MTYIRSVAHVALAVSLLPLTSAASEERDDACSAKDALLAMQQIYLDEREVQILVAEGTPPKSELPTRTLNELFAAWEKAGAGVPLSTIETATRGQTIVGVVFFSGCTANDSGVCYADASFQVFKPDGSEYGPEETAELWTRPPPREGQIQLSVGAIGVRIEPEDPIGTYLIRARLRDKVSHAEVELTRSFRVAE